MGNNENSSKILLESGNNEVEFLEFLVCHSSFAINVSKVCQTILLKDNPISPMPGSVEGIEGITYFRGNPITVVDLKKLLALNGEETDFDRKLLLVAEINTKIVAFLVDDVVAIRRVTWEEFKPISSNNIHEMESSVVGTICVGDNVLMVLDLESLLGSVDPSMKIRVNNAASLSMNEQRSKVKIIYCEDSSIVQKLLVNTLSSCGYSDITCFQNGKEGFEYLSNTDPNVVNIILSDIEMPEMDGLTLCNRIKKIQGYEQIPFIFFSSMISDSMRNKCISMGGSDCFSKPQLDQIVAALDKLFI